MKYLALLILIFSGCKSHEVSKRTLHNYPVFDKMDCPREFSVENESYLRSQAKSLNMKYVDYLHYINKRKIEKSLALGE